MHDENDTDMNEKEEQGAASDGNGCSTLPDGAVLAWGSNGKWHYKPETIPVTRENILPFIRHCAKKLDVPPDRMSPRYLAIPDDILKIVKQGKKDRGKE